MRSFTVASCICLYTLIPSRTGCALPPATLFCRPCTHAFVLLQIAYAATDEVLVTGGYDQAVRMWDCRSRSFEPIQTMKNFGDAVTSVAVADRCCVHLCQQVELYKAQSSIYTQVSCMTNATYIQHDQHFELSPSCLVMCNGL